MKPIAVIGDSWAVGPAVGQPNLGTALATFGIPTNLWAEPTTEDVLALIQNYIAAGGTGKEFSMVLISSGGHDMMQGVPAAQTVSNLVAIGKDVAALGLQCEVIGFPQIVMNGNYATTPDLTQDAAFYDQAAAQSPGIQILHGAVNYVLSNFPTYENVAYSEFISHYNDLGSVAFAGFLVGVYGSLNS